MHWPAEAGFWLVRSFGYFPAGTVHVAVVDPGVGTSREIIAVTAKGHVFLAPDNGLLAPIVARNPGASIVKLTAARLAHFGVRSPSATFHGRDIFAPIAAELAAARCVPADLGERQADLMPAWVDEPTVERNAISGVVITLDHFGNLITNIDGDLLKGLEKPTVHAGNTSSSCCGPTAIPTGAVSGPRELVWSGGDRPGGAERGGRPGPRAGAPVVIRHNRA